MTDINNKELLLEAIDHYDLYSMNKRNILKIIVNASIEGIARISGKRISELSNKSLGNVFLTLRNLEKDGFIKRVKNPGEQYFSYTLNSDKIKFLTKLYYHNTEQLKK